MSSRSSGGSGGGAGSRLIVNRRRQEGNPVLKYVRNVRYEWGDIGADFECGSTCGVLYLALKVRRKHKWMVANTPINRHANSGALLFRINLQRDMDAVARTHRRTTILTRLSGKEENKYACRILLTLCNVDEPRHTLRELNLPMLSDGLDASIVLFGEVEEAAEYIEKFEIPTARDPISKKPVFVPVDEKSALQNAAVGILTGARSVTKADAQRLLFNFGTLKAISEATEEQLALCPGLGPIRAKNLYNYLRTPFTS
ncbi:hypothetical protein OSTOST_11584 [Ostertagia ostertagi]